MTTNQPSFILIASCPDGMGINRAVSNFIFDLGASITQTDQFSEIETQRFFMRYAFHLTTGHDANLETLKAQFAAIGNALDMDWQIFAGAIKPRIMIAVSRSGHCLNDLLFRWRNGDLCVDVAGVISNHEDLRAVVEWHDVPYHHLPVSGANRSEQEADIWRLIQNHNVDLLVLARYMQILSPDLCAKLNRRAINIHHSFLPSFKGAKPYHQARNRGVKLIGATAHYVTADLDDGPIIEQDVQRIAHSQDSDELTRIGSEIEARVLTRAVRWHCDHRVLLSDHRTIVFS